MALIGPDTLNWAIRSVPVPRVDSITQQKRPRSSRTTGYPSTTLAVGCCYNFVVQDDYEQTLF
jgi:hypothetical protein